MRTTQIRRSRKKLVIAISALVISAAPYVSSGSRAWGDPSAGDPPAGDKYIRKLQQQEFLREHSDASGKPRPDLWRKGVEQQKQMQVAPYIGWTPPSTSSGKPSSTGKK